MCAWKRYMYVTDLLVLAMFITRNNPLRMGFYCVLTLSPDVPYLFLPKIGQKRQNWQFLGIFGDIHIQIWRHCEIWQFWPFLQCCQMVQIKNHQKLVKNAKISDFWGKFTTKSGDTFEFEYKKGFFTSK